MNGVCMLLMLQACKIVEGQRYTKRLNERQITALLKVTCQRPRDRENDILQVLVTFWYCLFLELLNRVIVQTLQDKFCGLGIINRSLLHYLVMILRKRRMLWTLKTLHSIPHWLQKHKNFIMSCLLQIRGEKKNPAF